MRAVYNDAVWKKKYGFSSSRAEVSMIEDWTSPAITMSGAPSLRASIAALMRCVTPGPAVPQIATGSPVR